MERSWFRPRNAVGFSHTLIGMIAGEGDTVVDATCGNGRDTLFLARLVGPRGKVYAFDIQEQAINNTRRLLQEHDCLERTVVILDDHQYMGRYIKSTVRAAMFNLGYLPGGSKEIITIPETTVAALTGLLPLLAVGGLITVVGYTGHPGGKKEVEQVLEYVSTLDQTRFCVVRVEFLNQANEPPQLIAIEKLRGDAIEGKAALRHSGDGLKPEN